MMNNLKEKMLLSKTISIYCTKNDPAQIAAGGTTVKHLNENSIANKTSTDKILILVKPFSGARTGAIKNYS